MFSGEPLAFSPLHGRTTEERRFDKGQTAWVSPGDMAAVFLSGGRGEDCSQLFSSPFIFIDNFTFFFMASSSLPHAAPTTRPPMAPSL